VASDPGDRDIGVRGFQQQRKLASRIRGPRNPEVTWHVGPRRTSKVPNHDGSHSVSMVLTGVIGVSAFGSFQGKGLTTVELAIPRPPIARVNE
jgi:hypothetical protein